MVTFQITEPSGPAAPGGPALGTQAGGREQTPRQGLRASCTRQDSALGCLSGTLNDTWPCPKNFRGPPSPTDTADSACSDPARTHPGEDRRAPSLDSRSGRGRPVRPHVGGWEQQVGARQPAHSCSPYKTVLLMK